MEVINVSLTISAICIVFTILNFFYARKDKSVGDTASSQYKMGVLEQKVDNISKQLDKILDKLDVQDQEIDEKIEKAIERHVLEFHKDKE